MARKPGESIDADLLARAADAVLAFVHSWPVSVCRCPWPPDTMVEDSAAWQGEVPEPLRPFDREDVIEATEFLLRCGLVVTARGGHG